MSKRNFNWAREQTIETGDCGYFCKVFVGHGDFVICECEKCPCGEKLNKKTGDEIRYFLGKDCSLYSREERIEICHTERFTDFCNKWDWDNGLI